MGSKMDGRKPKERDYNRSFGSLVRALRKIRFPAMTIEEFAELLGITGPYQTKIELGKVPPPSQEIVLALAETLQANPKVLLGMAGYPQHDHHVSWVSEGVERYSRSELLLDEHFDLTLLGDKFGIVATPGILRYWGILCKRIAEYIEKGEILPEDLKLDHTNIISFALLRSEAPFPEIRTEALKELRKHIEKGNK